MARVLTVLAVALIALALGAWGAGAWPARMLCQAGDCTSPGAGDGCLVQDEGGCLWPAASDGVRQKRDRDKGHAGDEGVIMRDGQPAPRHECTACHDEPDLLPEAHLPTAGMSMDGCRICHGTDQAASLDDRLFQSHSHFFADIGCATCHQDPAAPETPDTALCTSCHGSLEDLGALTRHLEDTVGANPHSTPHGAPFANCALCHHQHEPAVNFCAKCHDFDFTMP
ncbi:cytochrome c3 family protein [Tropicibacter oceani]|uniref:Cytochrome c3 family protein n=1 Tax=Tropicibacter oceani TaxID=3058420 RepID=A0ABY8QEH3_9RHOB|nr:cytochrome c3 family protein [Tropicibacter oceani]WGW02406.1 cytochrome c3 family protein [Tropicibacter oceani]